MRESVRIAANAALGPAKRNVDDGALPGHPRCQRTNFINIHIGRVAYAALGRAASEIVLDAKAFKDFYAPGIHARRDVDLQLAVGDAHHRIEIGVQIEQLRRAIKARHHGFKRIVLLDLSRIINHGT